MTAIRHLIARFWPSVRLPTLSDGAKRYATPAQYAKLSAMAKAAGKPLGEFMELGGHLEKGKLKL